MAVLQPNGHYYCRACKREDLTREECPVPDIINTATRRGIGSNGQQTEELYTRVQTKGSTGKHAA